MTAKDLMLVACCMLLSCLDCRNDNMSTKNTNVTHKVWSRFHATQKDGSVIKLRIQDLPWGQHKDDIVDYCMKYFIKDEAFHKAAGISNNEEAKTEYQELLYAYYDEKEPHVSICCVDDDSNTNDILGISLINDVNTQSNDDEEFKPKTKEVQNLFHLISVINDLKSFKGEVYYEGIAISVRPDHKGLGIANEFIRLRKQICIDNNIQMSGAWMTSIGIQKAADKNNWKTLKEIPVDEFEKKTGLSFEVDTPIIKLMSMLLDLLAMKASPGENGIIMVITLSKIKTSKRPHRRLCKYGVSHGTNYIWIYILIMEELREVLSEGVLAYVFRISRFAGVAPFTFTQRGPVISRSLTLYSYILVTFINAVVLAGFAIDLLTEPSRSLRASTPTSRLVWIANFTIVILIASVSVYHGPSRIACNINTLKQIIKIKIFIGIKIKPDSTEKNRRVTVVLISAGLCFLIFCDLYGYVIEALYWGKDVRTLVMYSFLYYEYILTLLVELQFVLLALQLQTILQTINEGLKNQIRYGLENDGDMKFDNHSIHSDKDGITAINNYVFRRQSIKRSKSVDFMSAINKTSSREKEVAVQVPDKFKKSIKDFAVAYGGVCDVLRQLDRGHGLVLLLIIVSFFLQLVITPYYMITSLYSAMDWRVNIVLQLFWCIFHICDMLLVVEPCHRTQEEMKQTQVLVCLMMRTISSTNDPLLAELDLFRKQLTLNRPSYSPLGMCTMSRPLTVTIIGAVTTYLVIIFQFRTFELNLKS